MWSKRNINRTNILLVFFTFLIALCSCQFSENESNRMSDDDLADNHASGASQVDDNDNLTSSTKVPSIVAHSQEEMRDLSNICLTDLSKAKALMEYSQGDMFDELEIYELSHTQVQANSQWEDLTVYVEFHGSLQITGTIFFNRDAPSSFVISEESYSSVPAIIVNNVTYPKEIGIDIDAVMNEYRTEIEENDSGEIDDVTLVFGTFIIAYARESGMTSGGEIIDVKRD